MGLDSLQDGLTNVVNTAKSLVTNPVTTAISGAVIGSAITGAVIAGVASRKKKRRKTTSKKSSKRRTRKYKYARTAGKRKDTSRRRIRQTKNGQPYIILASGKARFISKRSAKLSRSRKGGRY